MKPVVLNDRHSDKKHFYKIGVIEHEIIHTLIKFVNS